MQTVTITDFEGPLDLLLYLIKTNDFDIYDIKIEEITNQYLEYLKSMEELNLDIASEYLTMATELILIKSNSLLPRPQVIEEEIEPVNSLKELQERLIAYQEYKDASVHLRDNAQERKQYLSKLPSLLDEYTDGMVNYVHQEGDINTLVDAFKDFLTRVEDQKPLETKVTTKEITISDRRVSIIGKLKHQHRLNFTELFELNDKGYIIVTFLTVLEMYKKQELIIIQENNFSDIFIEAGERL